MSYVLVTDGRSRASLPIIRSLGKKGIKVISGDSRRICSSFFSRYTKKRIVYPDPETHTEEFITYLIEFVKKNDVEMIIPVRDAATLALSKHKAELSEFTKIPVGEYEMLLKARDKAETIKIAERLGIPHPKTNYADNPDFDEIKRDFAFPVMIKARKSSGSRGIVYLESPENIEEIYKKTTKEYGPCMIQEFIPAGGAYGVSMLFDNGVEKAIFTHKRLREYPISGGPSTLRLSVRHAEAEEYARKILEHLRWHGVAMVEFRIDSRDNKPKLMEINPRFWGSLSLAIFAGVDFPHLLYKMGSGENVDSVFQYKLNVKTRWLIMGDILWFLSNPKKAEAFREFIKFKEDNLGYDIMSLRDPLPVFGAILEGMVTLSKGKRRKHVFRRGW